MTDDTPESMIPYDEIVQEALRAVVGRVLGEVERSGALPGGHHFYITFKTRMQGVDIPKHLVQRFPEEMTIVIQHRYWDLKVTDEQFSVGLSFGGVASILTVPFAAETCGPFITADARSVFVAVQHPGEADGSTFENPSSTWPHTHGCPRPSVVVAYKP